MARAQAKAMLNRNLGDTTFMHEIIMGYQGEMSLKGLNRNQFESAMMKILRYRLKTVGKFKVYCTQSTFYMEPEEEDVDMDLAFDRVSKVFGLAALSRAVVCDKDFDTICQTAEDYLGASLHGIRTFKVEARRSDKTYPMTSPELMRELGAYLLGKHNYLKVDVHNPDFKVIVEIRDYGAYIHGPKVPGEGGLPVGASLDDLGKGLRSQVGTMFGTKAKGARYLELAQGYVTRMALNDKNEIIAFEFLNLGKFTDAVKAGKTPEEAIAGAMGHYGQWENAAKYIDPRTDEETHSVASVFPVHE